MVIRAGSEPTSGSDLASLKLKAESDGDHLVLNGSKIWTTHAHYANKMFLLVRSDTPDPDYTNAKTYQMPGGAVTPNDNFRRLLLHGDITLRNPRLMLRGGA